MGLISERGPAEVILLGLDAVEFDFWILSGCTWLESLAQYTGEEKGIVAYRISHVWMFAVEWAQARGSSACMRDLLEP